MQAARGRRPLSRAPLLEEVNSQGSELEAEPAASGKANSRAEQGPLRPDLNRLPLPAGSRLVQLVQRGARAAAPALGASCHPRRLGCGPVLAGDPQLGPHPQPWLQGGGSIQGHRLSALGLLVPLCPGSLPGRATHPSSPLQAPPAWGPDIMGCRQDVGPWSWELRSGCIDRSRAALRSGPDPLTSSPDPGAMSSPPLAPAASGCPQH